MRRPLIIFMLFRPKAREKESVRVEIPKNEEKVFEQGQDVVLGNSEGKAFVASRIKDVKGIAFSIEKCYINNTY